MVVIRLRTGLVAAVVLASLTFAAPASATGADDATTTVETVDPVASAVDAYVDAAGGGTDGASGSWLFVAAFAVALAGTFVIAVRLRRRHGSEPT